jgi:membrane-bound ClpP family serine protease
VSSRRSWPAPSCGFEFFPNSRVAARSRRIRRSENINAEKPELLHQTGAALTPLRPSGTAIINGRRVDVVTEGGMIERNTPVKVVAIEGMRVVVRAVDGAVSEKL